MKLPDLPSLLERLPARFWLHRPNFTWSAAIIFLLFLIEILFRNFVNSEYRFNISSFSKYNFLYVFILVFLVSYLPRIFRYAIVAIIFIMTLCQLLFFNYFGTYIQPINYIQLLPDFLLIAESFFELIDRMYIVFALAAAALALFIALEKFTPRKRTSYFVIPVLLVLLGLDMARALDLLNTPGRKITGAMSSQMLPGPDRLAADNAYRSLRYLAMGILPKRWSQQLLEERPLPEPTITVQAPRANIVLVIGETVRASQMGILGYKGNDTTPLLKKVDGLFASTIYSAGTMTRTSWVGLLHRLERPGLGQQFKSQSNCLFRLAKQNHFRTHFVYAYDEGAAYTLRSFMCPTYVDNFLSNSDFPPKLRTFDKNLLSYLSQVDWDEPNFIVMGPRGAHTPYKDKSPKSAKKFKSEYDNAIAYTDRVLNAMIKQIRERSKIPTYFIFTSDHGELLEGESDRLRHGWFRDDVFKVPFLFLSLNTQDKAVDAVLPNVHSHFDLSTLVIDLLGYDAKVGSGPSKDIYVNGSDIYGLAGYMKVRLENGKVLSQIESDW